MQTVFPELYKLPTLKIDLKDLMFHIQIHLCQFLIVQQVEDQCCIPCIVEDTQFENLPWGHNLWTKAIHMSLNLATSNIHLHDVNRRDLLQLQIDHFLCPVRRPHYCYHMHSRQLTLKFSITMKFGTLHVTFKLRNIILQVFHNSLALLKIEHFYMWDFFAKWCSLLVTYNFTSPILHHCARYLAMFEKSFNMLPMHFGSCHIVFSSSHKSCDILKH